MKQRSIEAELAHAEELPAFMSAEHIALVLKAQKTKEGAQKPFIKVGHSK